VIRRRLGRFLDWRFGAVVTRLDALGNHLGELHGRLNELSGRVDAQASRLDTLLEKTEPIQDLAENVKSMRSTLEQRVEPMLRAVLDEESENRRRLYDLRARPDYERAYSDPDPLVSVTLATSGREGTLLGRALPSLLAQTHANLEVLVVGDAVASEFGEAVVALGDPRVSYANLSQRITAHTDPGKHWLVGSTMPRNEATRRARGRWLLHFDDDDHLRPDAVASLLEVVRIERAEVAYGGFEAHYPDRERVTCMSFPPRPGYFSWAGALMHGGLRFFERELFAAQLELPGDVYMLERMLRAGVRFAMLEEVLLDYFPSTHWEQTEPPPG